MVSASNIPCNPRDISISMTESSSLPSTLLKKTDPKRLLSFHDRVVPPPIRLLNVQEDEREFHHECSSVSTQSTPYSQGYYDRRERMATPTSNAASSTIMRKEPDRISTIAKKDQIAHRVSSRRQMQMKLRPPSPERRMRVPPNSKDSPPTTTKYRQPIRFVADPTRQKQFRDKLQTQKQNMTTRVNDKAHNPTTTNTSRNITSLKEEQRGTEKLAPHEKPRESHEKPYKRREGVDETIPSRSEATGGNKTRGDSRVKQANGRVLPDPAGDTHGAGQNKRSAVVDAEPLHKVTTERSGRRTPDTKPSESRRSSIRVNSRRDDEARDNDYNPSTHEIKARRSSVRDCRHDDETRDKDYNPSMDRAVDPRDNTNEVHPRSPIGSRHDNNNHRVVDGKNTGSRSRHGAHKDDDDAASLSSRDKDILSAAASRATGQSGSRPTPTSKVRPSSSQPAKSQSRNGVKDSNMDPPDSSSKKIQSMTSTRNTGYNNNTSTWTSMSDDFHRDTEDPNQPTRKVSFDDYMTTSSCSSISASLDPSGYSVPHGADGVHRFVHNNNYSFYNTKRPDTIRYSKVKSVLARVSQQQKQRQQAQHSSPSYRNNAIATNGRDMLPVQGSVVRPVEAHRGGVEQAQTSQRQVNSIGLNIEVPLEGVPVVAATSFHANPSRDDYADPMPYERSTNRDPPAKTACSRDDGLQRHSPRQQLHYPQPFVVPELETKNSITRSETTERIMSQHYTPLSRVLCSPRSRASGSDGRTHPKEVDSRTTNKQ